MEALSYINVDNLTSSTPIPSVQFQFQQFEWPEYVVFSIILAFSVGIGIFYGCFGDKQKSNEEYLLGGRKMNPFPVALSLLCSYVSSVTLLGHTVEIYLYGTQLFMVLLCYIPLTWSLAYLYVPLYFELQITSVYEYLELRFSRPVRITLSLINVVYMIFFMSMVVYGPALALSFVTGINHRILVAVIFLVCLFYSTLGGFKAVLWTDTLQAIIMFLSLGLVVILGISVIDGGLSTIWQRAKETDRINFFNFDPDLRTRHTFWTAVVGGYFTWLPMYANQAQIQRYISLPTLRSVKIALLINLVGLSILMGLCYLGGLVIYGTYFDCDPITSGRVKTVDQLLPVFVMDTLGGYKGLPGLFVAGITCAGLSTVSSTVNALAAHITEDYVRKYRPNLTDSQLAGVSKLTALITGLFSFAFVFVAEQMNSIFSATTTLLGILGGPTLGIFICGQFFPWSNTVGAVGGMIVSFGWMAFLGIGSTIAGNRKLLPSQVLPLDMSGEFCPFISSPTNATNATVSSIYWKDRDDSVLIQILSLSYLWYPAAGCLTAVFFGLVFSFAYRIIKGTAKIQRVPSRLFIPLVLKMWLKICPEQVRKLVSFEVVKPVPHVPPSTSDKSMKESNSSIAPVDPTIEVMDEKK